MSENQKFDTSNVRKRKGEDLGQDTEKADDKYDKLELRNRTVTETLSLVSDFGQNTEKESESAPAGIQQTESEITPSGNEQNVEKEIESGATEMEQSQVTLRMGLLSSTEGDELEKTDTMDGSTQPALSMGNKTKPAFEDIEKTVGTDGTAVQDFMNFVFDAEDYGRHIPGETFTFPGLKEAQGLKLAEAKADKMPPWDDRDDDVYGDFDSQFKITVHASTSVYGSTDESQQKMLNDIKVWLLGDNGDYAKILKQELVRSEPTFYEVTTVMLLDSYMMSHVIGDVIDSPFYHEFWNKHIDKVIVEGICYVHDKVPNDLRKRLQNRFDEVAQKMPVDYHPKSNDIVRDLVHPALYPYIKGVSKMKKDVEPTEPNEEEHFDFWGRKYEDSKFQWLPTPFKITNERKCKIQEYINNLDKTLFPEFYQDLEELFEIFLPYFEEVWSYSNAIEFFKGDDGDDAETEEIPPLKKKPVSFTGQELQIIVKVVEYNLQPGQSYEGVWHAEGMSHENIVMTGIYFLDRSPNISGGDLRFKRAFTVPERSKVFWQIPQDRPSVVNDFAFQGFIPLGKFPTEKGYLLVFPNCHIHKISKMINLGQKDAANRKIIVFFFVNPEKKIVSTREVAPQQADISLNAAKEYRLELMAERKYDKDKLNVRNIELCEH